jgi:hypothetical protein
MIPIFAKQDRKGGVFEVAGLTLASVLLAFEMLTVCKYWVYLRVLSQKTLGLRWRRSDAQPHRGHELLNGSLCEVLASGKLCFSPEDLQRLGVSVFKQAATSRWVKPSISHMACTPMRSTSRSMMSRRS